MKHTHLRLPVIIATSLVILTTGSVLVWRKQTHATVSNLSAEAGSQAIWDTMASVTNNNLNSKKDLVDTFCKSVALHSDGFVDQAYNLAYSAQQSIFVTALCTSLDNDPLFIHKDILRTTERAGIAPMLSTACRPDNLENCDLAELSSSLFKAIMNDHSTLGIAGRTLVGEKKPKDIANEFSKMYYGDDIGTAICKDDAASYISSKSASNVNSALCAHSRTYNLLLDSIAQLQRQGQRLRTIDSTKLKGLPTTDCTKKTKLEEIPDLFTCSYTLENSKGNNAAMQHNLRHNELMYYHIFLAWISTKLSDPKFQPTRLTSDRTRQTSGDLAPDQSLQIGSLTREIDLSRTAVDTMEQSITNFNATFPLHIGLRAYQEDVIGMRKALAKVYTPVHQLYYKLRNVQKKE